MNIPFLPWIAVTTIALALPLLTVLVIRARRPAAPKPLPTDWTLIARPVFSTDERRIYRLLREALPHHIVLSKLPLVRFCQPSNPAETSYWYDLLGAHHVAFAVCSANGRVLAAIDIDSERNNSRRAVQIKQSVLDACRVRYLRCPPNHLPSIAELQLLVPHSGATSRAPMPVPSLNQARDTLASTVATRRAERTALWQESTLFQDSFFAPDSRLDAFGSSDFSVLSSRASTVPTTERDDDIVGVVVDEAPIRHGS